MGNACVSSSRTSRVAPPSRGQTLTSDEVRQIVKDAFGLEGDVVAVGDRDYFAYSLDELKAFLEADLTDKLNYQSETLDCDDFARILVGRERQWFSGQRFAKAGSTFGTLWGDIRPSEDYNEPYYHALNFFIDDQRDVYIIEPQSDRFQSITSNSTFYRADV